MLLEGTEIIDFNFVLSRINQTLQKCSKFQPQGLGSILFKFVRSFFYLKTNALRESLERTAMDIW